MFKLHSSLIQHQKCAAYIVGSPIRPDLVAVIPAAYLKGTTVGRKIICCLSSGKRLWKSDVVEDAVVEAAFQRVAEIIVKFNCC